MRPHDHFPRAAAPAWRAAAFAALAGLPGLASAVTLSPVLIEVSPARPIVTLTVSNPGDQPMRYQAQVLAWTQANGAEQRVASNELIVSPAIADIPAGGQQIFRIASRVPAGAQQRAYRLVLEDLGAAAPVAGQVGIQLHVNHDLPVFVSPKDLAPSRLALAECSTPRAGCVRVRNDGAQFGVVRAIRFDGVAKELTVNARVLAGAWREWQVPGVAQASLAAARVQTQDGELRAGATGAP
jgi:fimbrial chaperone protein